MGGNKPKKKGPPEGVYRLVLCRGECLRRHHSVFTQGTEYRLFGLTEAFDCDVLDFVFATIAEWDYAVRCEFCPYRLTLMLFVIEALSR